MMRTSEERTERILAKAKIEQKKQAAKRRKRIALTSVLGSVMAIILVFNLVLFVPYTVGGYDLSKYKKSEYYALMNKIGELTYTRPYKTNNFKEWGLGKSGNMDWGEAASPAPGASSSIISAWGTDPDSSSNNSTPPTYEEITNNQVSGVIEGDLFKRSNEYIWYLSRQPASWDKFFDEYGKKQEIYCPAGYSLRVYSISEKKLVNRFYIGPEEGTTFDYYRGGEEIFLSLDCKTLTVFAMCRTDESRMLYTQAINIDVSDPLSPKEIGRKYAAGGYVSARYVNGNLLLVTSFRLGTSPNFDDPSEYLPQVGDKGELVSLPMKDIVLPENADSAQYTVLVSLDAATLAVQDSAALFSYTSEIYVSENHLFAARSASTFHEVKKANSNYGYYTADTEITCFAYGKDSIELNGTVTAKGTIVDQYSMDEYMNVLRVVTTSTNEIAWWSSSDYAKDKDIADIRNKKECNLYCYDLSTLTLIASVENFSDPEESVKSVRFDGKKAYVCTAKVGYNYNFGNDYQLFEPIFIDPVFEFDLSDYSNITWKDTGTISGYSMSLIKFKDDTLLGIGYGDDRNILKIELYRTEESSVVPIAKFELKRCSFSSDFKAYFIDAEHGLIGLAADYYVSTVEEFNMGFWTDSYILLRFDGEQLAPIEFVSLNRGNYSFDNFRACYIDGEVFIISDNEFEVVNVD